MTATTTNILAADYMTLTAPAQSKIVDLIGQEIRRRRHRDNAGQAPHEEPEPTPTRGQLTRERALVMRAVGHDWPPSVDGPDVLLRRGEVMIA